MPRKTVIATCPAGHKTSCATCSHNHRRRTDEAYRLKKNAAVLAIYHRKMEEKRAAKRKVRL